jgi:hypothetical protein
MKRGLMPVCQVAGDVMTNWQHGSQADFVAPGAVPGL